MSHQFKKCLVWSLNHCLHQAYVVHLPSHGKHTSFHSQQLQTPSPCLTCAESGQHTKLLSDRLTFSTAPNPSLLSQTHLCWKWPTCKCLELFSDRLTFSTAPNPSLSVSDSPVLKVANMQMSRAVQWQTYILHSSEPFFLSQSHLCRKWPMCKCLQSLCERKFTFSTAPNPSLSVWDSPVLKVANMQMSWVILWQTYILFSTAPNPSLCVSETHLCWKRPMGKCLESLSDRRLAQLKVNLWTAAQYCPVHRAVDDIHLSKVFCNVLPSQSCCCHWIIKSKKR